MLAQSQNPTPTGRIHGRILQADSGQYLNNVRVKVKDTGFEAFTDQTGTYQLARVPAGNVVLEIFHTGLQAQEATLILAAGQSVERNFEVAGSAVQLAAMVVGTSRETDAEKIAINEQRFSPNIKNVLSADALGDITDGNVAEFLKFLPGVVAEYDPESAGAAASLSLRGFPTELAVVSTDGAQVANTGNAGGGSRVFQFSQASLNNVARLEITKVPTPSSPADSLAGSINMVTKSAFERKTAQFRYSAMLLANGSAIHLGKSPHPSDERIYKIQPSGSFDYTLPVNDRFGIVLTGQSANRYIPQTRPIRTFQTGGAGTGASASQPFLQQYQMGSVPRITNRESFGLRADWRVTRYGVLSANLQSSHFKSDRSVTAILFNAGTAGTPSVAGGVPLTFGPDFTEGATGRGSITLMNGADVVQELDTLAGNTSYRFDNGDWRVVAGASQSRSWGGYKDTAAGRWRQMGIVNLRPVRITYAGVDSEKPRSVQAFENNGQPFDIFDLNNYRLNTAFSNPRDIEDELTTFQVDVRKSITQTAFPAAMQIGAHQRTQTRDIRRFSATYTYNGRDGNPATIESPAPYQATSYKTWDDVSGYPGMPHVSLGAAWRAHQANPQLFTQTPAQEAASETYRVNNSEYIKERVSSAYAQGELTLLNGRLRVLGGVRLEKTDLNGRGPLYDPTAVFVRNAAGAFVRTATGATIRKPEAGAVGSLAEVRLVRQERAARAARSYDGTYPSLHLTYNLRENLLLRAAYAKTYGRPDFDEIIPNTTVDEEDDDLSGNPASLPGRLNVRNSGLKPWSADNYDLSLEWYTPQGGLISGGVFAKEIDGFFADEVATATAASLAALGLDDRYVGWLLTTRRNLTTAARITGVELSIRQSLAPVSPWLSHVQVFANGTKLHLSGPPETRWQNFVPESANWGLTFSRQGLLLGAKWNYRGLQRRQPIAIGYAYQGSQTTFDVNAEYRLRSHLTVFMNVQNLFDVPQTWMQIGDQTPDYAKSWQTFIYGAQLTFGIKGTF